MSDATDPNKEYVNGPLNVVRLEGNIGNTKKVIYLFLDMHNPCHLQSRCENIFSTDLDKYLADSFYKLNSSDHKYDFFLEIFPTDIINIKYGYPFDVRFNMNDIYIKEVWKLFVKTFNFDKEKNIVKSPDIFKNVRLHYADIRAFFEMDDYDNLKRVERIAHSFWHDGFYKNGVDQIVELLGIAKDHYKQLVTIFNKLKKDKKIKIPTPRVIGQPEKDENRDPVVHIAYLLHKITTKYNHSEVQKRLNAYLENYLKQTTELMKEIDELTERVQNYYNDITKTDGELMKFSNGFWAYGPPSDIVRKLIVDVINRAESVFAKYVDFYTRIMDIYFLRRFLDKDYITNGIAYTGAWHSMFYVYMLVQVFDFRVTHFSYSKIKNLKELNKKIKDAKHEYDISEWLNPPFVNQCSDMSNFPKNFE